MFHLSDKIAGEIKKEATNLNVIDSQLQKLIESSKIAMTEDQMREAETHYETIKDDQEVTAANYVHLPENGQDGPRASTHKTEESKNSGGSANSSGSSAGKKSTGSTKDSLQVQPGLKQIEERPSLENKSGDMPPDTPRFDSQNGDDLSGESDEEVDQAAFVDVPL